MDLGPAGEGSTVAVGASKEPLPGALTTAACSCAVEPREVIDERSFDEVLRTEVLSFDFFNESLVVLLEEAHGPCDAFGTSRPADVAARLRAGSGHWRIGRRIGSFSHISLSWHGVVHRGARASSLQA